MQSLQILKDGEIRMAIFFFDWKFERPEGYTWIRIACCWYFIISIFIYVPGGTISDLYVKDN